MTSTTKTEETEVLLKTDRLGRVRMPAEKRELLLDRFEQSGMSGQAFAVRIGVKYSTFATWVQKRRRSRGEYANEGGEEVKAPLALIEAVIESSKPETTSSDASLPMELETAGGLKLRLSGTSQVSVAVELLKALRDAEL